MLRTLTIGLVIASSFASPARADWWIVRSSDKQCLVVDVEPTDKNVTKIGKGSYRTEEEAEAEAKRLCKEPTFVPKHDSDDG
jgi:hypothetical protein